MTLALWIILGYLALSLAACGLRLWAVTRPRKTWRED